jgi:hypothetical protein
MNVAGGWRNPESVRGKVCRKKNASKASAPNIKEQKDAVNGVNPVFWPIGRKLRL